uniref:Putative tick transposon n=1 Tax=Ixodes ricinus TaxID=34613 RepID=A0A6B0US36_IXORI
MVLTSASGLALVQLAQLADTVMEVAAPQVAPIAAMQSHPLGASANISAAETTEDSFRTDIQQAIKALTAQVAALTSRSRSEHRQRFTSRPRYSSPSQARAVSRHSDICWYHRTFGDRARNCVGSCSASGNACTHH